VREDRARATADSDADLDADEPVDQSSALTFSDPPSAPGESSDIEDGPPPRWNHYFFAP
jgi:hypothetical protein